MEISSFQSDIKDTTDLYCPLVNNQTYNMEKKKQVSIRLAHLLLFSFNRSNISNKSLNKTIYLLISINRRHKTSSPNIFFLFYSPQITYTCIFPTLGCRMWEPIPSQGTKNKPAHSLLQSVQNHQLTKQNRRAHALLRVEAFSAFFILKTEN